MTMLDCQYSLVNLRGISIQGSQIGISITTSVTKQFSQIKKENHKNKKNLKFYMNLKFMFIKQNAILK